MKFIKSNKTFIRNILLPLYGSFPLLVLSLLLRILPGKESGTEPVFPGIVLFLTVFHLLLFIFRARSRNSVLIAGMIYVVLFSSSLLFVAAKIQQNYSFLVTGLFYSPLLTVALHLIRKHYPRQAVEQSSAFISLGLFLLASYYAVFHIFTLYLIFTVNREFLITELSTEVYEIFNLIPLFIIILKLRRESSTILYFSKEKISFQGRDVSSLFTELQKKMLFLFFRDTGNRLNCRELSKVFPEPCVEEGDCKPTVCLLYAKVYRQVNDLKKKLNSLQIGSIVSPLNKQKIRDFGWRLRFYSGVRLKSSFSSGVDISGETAETSSENLLSEAFNNDTKITEFTGLSEGAQRGFTAFISIFASFSLSVTLLIHKVYGFYGFGIFLFLFFFLFFLPTIYRTGRWFFTSLFLSFITVEATAFILCVNTDAEMLLFFTLKNITLFLVVFLLKYHHCESNGKRIFPKESVFRAIFWILWFYLAGLLVFRDYNFPSGAGAGSMKIMEIISDSIVLFAALISSFWFLRYQKKVVLVKKHVIEFSGKHLNESLSSMNLRMLEYFLEKRGGNVTCRNLVPLLYPDETYLCRQQCKPSLCPAYQRIYKRIREVRKVVEVFEMGTILSPDKNSDVRTEGWKLMLFADIGVKM